MPNTTCFEDFELFILTSLPEHLETNKGSETTFLKDLRQRTDNVRGEARRNHEESVDQGRDSMRFFYDLLRKLESLEGSIFTINNNEILYTPDNVLCDARDSIEKIFLLHIFNAIQEIKDCFTGYLPLPPNDYQFQISLSKFHLLNKISVLNDGYHQLIKFGFIPERTDKKNFVNVFTGGLVEKPILWRQGYNSLAYFMKGLIARGALAPLNKKHWKETLKYFITEDGKIPDTNSLRSSDPPEDTENLDHIIDTFCTPTD